MRTRKQDAKSFEAMEAWNAKYPPGTAVDLKRADGSVMRTNTVGYSGVTMQGHAVIWLEGIRGQHLLSDCTPVIRTCIGCGGQVEPGETPSCGH